MIRFLITLGLVVLPTASAHAMFLEDLTVKPAPAATQTTTTEQQMTIEEIEKETRTDMQPLPTFADDHQMTRAEFAALLVRSRYTQSEILTCFWDIAPSVPPRFDLVYADLETDGLYAKEICVAMKNGIVRIPANGRFDGSRPIVFSEAATMMSRAFALEPYADADRVSTWYYKHVRALVRLNAVPMSVQSIDQRVTAAVATEMLDRVHNDITDRPSQSSQVLIPLRPAPAITPQQGSTSTSSSVAPKSVRPSSTPSAQASSQTSVAPATSSGKSWWDLF